MRAKKAIKYVGKKRRSCRLNQIPPTGNTKKSVHMSLVDHPISQPSLDISPIWTPIIAAEVRKLQLHPVYIKWGNLRFYVGTIQRICHFSDDFYSDSSLILTTIAMK
jgi:hypothetical protein